MVALVCSLPFVAASQEVEDNVARFRLLNRCGPVDLVVEGLPSAAAALNLRDEDIRTLGESRLRGARLFSDSAGPYLYINVNVVGRAFSADVEFYKWLNDPISGGNWPAKTWSSGSAGTAGASGGNFILQTLSRHVDRFLLEYLRVNEDYCR